MESTTGNINSNKNTESWQVELDSVRQFLLSQDHHPFPPHHVGIVAALNGIELERKRRQRDGKLQQKFMISSSPVIHDGDSNNNNNISSAMDGDFYEIEAVTMDTTAGTAVTTMSPPIASEVNTIMTDDWQDVTEDDVRMLTSTTTTAPIATTTTSPEQGTTPTEDATRNQNDDEQQQLVHLTKYVVSTFAAQNVQCRSPISALAVVCHMALLQNGRCICTGTPDDDDDNGGGFAPPIRDLPTGQLLPVHWDDKVMTTGHVQFRYRTIGYGTFHLSVLQEDTGMPEPTIRIALVSNKDNDTTHTPLRIALSDHINLQSWETAQKSTPSMKIPPALHYKRLSVFLRTFMEHVRPFTNVTTTTRIPPNDHFASHYASAGAIKDIPITTTTAKSSSSSCGNPVSSSLITSPPHQSFVPPPNVPMNSVRQPHIVGPMQGQFDGDLYPSGISAPFFHGEMSGNVMGPNHPIFNIRTGENNNNDDDHVGNINGDPFRMGIHGMTPRFDPFGPPGGPTEPPSRGTTFPGGNGNPNRDLAIPPPFGGNNMFL